MQMADLCIGKPGGLTTAEAMATGLPMVIVAPNPGQEDRNSNHLLEEGVAIKCNDFITLAYKSINSSIIRIAWPRCERKRWPTGRPQAAVTIVDTLLHENTFTPVKVGPSSH
jgi:processive 1,2-diacylglycerol beta-glucosyltransferase